MNTASGFPDGPRMPALLQTLNWLFRPISFLDRCRARYGETFSLMFVGFETPMVIVSDPEDVAALFKERSNGLPPGRSTTLEPILGPRSVLLLEGREHLERRKLMLPPFHGERMRAYEQAVTEVTRAELGSWSAGEEFPIHPRMQAITLEVILRAVFGVSDARRRQRLSELLATLLGEISSPWLQLRFVLSRRSPLIGDPLAALRERTAEVDRLLADEIAERRADAELESRTDILSLLVAARFEGGGGLSDEELRDQLMTLLLAGHETTATALAWTVDLLVRNQPALDRLRAELASGSEDYLRATISEALRLRPVVPLAGRRLGAELELGGHSLAAGSDVTPAIWLTHTRPQSYPEPLEFRPERFLDSPPETYSWIPFGGGTRRCLGAAFAEFEMRIVLRELLEQWELEGTRSRPERIARRNITFSPRRGTPVRVRPAV